ncbi:MULTISPECIES: isoprenyl transferase [unclassified Thermoanaerobacterium]|uniref:isoprenyl transferase n=1 Tax=unclassified Thermoanaerobacterium TaxID=2622527 RepID=UPI000A15B586|nr:MULTISPECIES: isoprenyl transferase [unclassified Thermoanaerobacterium]MDE4541808.1 isoprenyl transferase [Thermoanaerobacterium sp. R66]ORX24214.1 isoprenyl transferase [Thermoanaerobacterium sp. PSU-2]HHV73623.1 isoprenyl transferase [Thermoanaerobacterium sp.]
MGFIKKRQKDFDEDIEKKLDENNIPKHVAIIMDGNGRWAKKRGFIRTLGHRAGMEAVRRIVKASSEIGIKYLTLYAFSTENWKRPADEVNGLMDLLIEYLGREVNELNENNVKLNFIGDLSMIPEKCRIKIKESEEITKNNTGLTLNIALNYGGRSEIVRAFKRIGSSLLNGEIDLNDIDENVIADNLYTSGQPDPDLIIRPSGELRISNFMLWQSAYSELWFSDVLWPDFEKRHLLQAIFDYQKRNRRFGGI